MNPKAANSMLAKPSMPSSTTRPAVPMRVSPKPQRTDSSNTGSTSPSAKAPKKELGMMCSTNSVKPRGGIWLAYFPATAASRCFGSMCIPAPGWSRKTAARPVSKARMVNA